MKINFGAKVKQINGWLIVRLPAEVSAKLPSRGQVMVEVSSGGVHFVAPLEPDGMGGHWLHIDDNLSRKLGLGIGAHMTLAVEPVKNWPEAKLPADMQAALTSGGVAAKQTWQLATTMAHWEWLRWINSTAVAATRQHRIKVMLSKLASGQRRPCCFNRSACCVPQVSRNGRLIDVDD